MTGVLHTARINAIEVIVSSDKLIKMVNFITELKIHHHHQYCFSKLTFHINKTLKTLGKSLQ